MSFLHQYITTTDDLDAEAVIFTGRAKVVSITVSNGAAGAKLVVLQDSDDNTVMEVSLLATTTHTICPAMPIDYENGLKVAVQSSDGTDVHVTVGHSRSL